MVSEPSEYSNARLTGRSEQRELRSGEALYTAGSRVRVALRIWRALRPSQSRANLPLLVVGRQGKAVVEPRQAATQVLLIPCRRGLVAHVPSDAVGVIEVPQRPRLQLHACRAQHPRRLEAAERSRSRPARRG